jgi:hypothetical protein
VPPKTDSFVFSGFLAWFNSRKVSKQTLLGVVLEANAKGVETILWLYRDSKSMRKQTCDHTIKGYGLEEGGGSQMNNSEGLEVDLESGASYILRKHNIVPLDMLRWHRNSKDIQKQYPERRACCNRWERKRNSI